jgi:transposase-like protein
MTKSVGQPTIYTNILPNSKALSRINPKELSREAKFRLSFIEHYLNKTDNIAKTCRHFYITRSLFYKWYRRYNPTDLSTLENISRRPHRVRNVTYDYEVIKFIRSFREDKDTCYMSASKLAIVFKRDYPNTKFCLSGATIGRIIKKFHLFFDAIVRKVRTKSKQARKSWSALKQRRPAGLKATAPRTLIEFDMKHIYAGGISGPSTKYYALCAIDPITKESVIHVAKNCSSHQAKLALEKTIAVFGRNISILNDNGSENKGEAWQYLEDEQIMQYFTHPFAPKEKPYVERVIGSLQRECLDQRRNDIASLQDLDYYITRWLNNYHYYRPHNSLGGLTPDEFCDTLGLTIERREVCTM